MTENNKNASTRIRAVEAKTISNNTVGPMVITYNAIKEAAQQGLIRLVWDVSDLGNYNINRVKEFLEIDGYEVFINHESPGKIVLIISWDVEIGQPEGLQVNPKTMPIKKEKEVEEVVTPLEGVADVKAEK